MKTTLTSVLALAALGMAALLHSHDAAAVEAPKVCRTLYAGQKIDAGTVCVTNDETQLKVTYTTTGNWHLADLHLWVGKTLTTMPQTKTGNPQIGNFPYAVENVNSQTYTFTVPLGDFDITDSCAVTNPALYYAAHAALVLRDAAGNVIQTQTGWANGNQMNAKGSWAMYWTYQTQCVKPVTSAVTYSCETAFAVGDQTFSDLGIKNARWGWQLTIYAGPGASGSVPIYAGAGQNDLSKGTYVGDLHYSYSGGTLSLDYEMFSGWVMEATHVYAGSTNTTTTAPGQFGNQHDPLQNVTSDFYQLNVSGDTIFVVAHAVACQPASN